MRSKKGSGCTALEITIRIAVLVLLVSPFSSGALGQTLWQVTKFYLPGPAGKRFDYLTIHRTFTAFALDTQKSIAHLPLPPGADVVKFDLSLGRIWLMVMDTGRGKSVQTLSAVGDCDDIFFDQARKRIYATGGVCVISVFAQQEGSN